MAHGLYVKIWCHGGGWLYINRLLYVVGKIVYKGELG